MLTSLVIPLLAEALIGVPLALLICFLTLLVLKGVDWAQPQIVKFKQSDRFDKFAQQFQHDIPLRHKR